MRRIILPILLALCTLSAQAAQHTMSLNWTASPDSTAASPGTTSVYWAQGACPASGLGTLTWNQATAQGLPSYTAASPYVVNLPSAGTYCAYVTATIGGATSVPSNTAGGTANPFPVTITVTVQ